MSRSSMVTIAAMALVAGSAPLAAQGGTPADSALPSCSAAARAKNEREAKTAAGRAERLFRARADAALRYARNDRA